MSAPDRPDSPPDATPAELTLSWGPATRLVHGAPDAPPIPLDAERAVVPPISASTTFHLESQSRASAGFAAYGEADDPEDKVHIYERLDEPVRAMLEQRLAGLEGGDCAVAFASGMGAISAALMHRLRAGDEVVAHPTLYTCTHTLLHDWLPRYGIRVRFHDLRDDLHQLQLHPETRAVYCESPTNPTLDLLDLEAIGQRVQAANADREADTTVRMIVDNTFATPYCQRPLEHGADVVVASLTKGLNGFGTDMGGVVVAPRADRPSLLRYRKDFGGSLAPTPAWRILTFGLPTLELRTRAQQQNATALARFLTAHPRVARVEHPSLLCGAEAEVARRQMVDPRGAFAPGSLVYFELNGADPATAADRLVDHLGAQRGCLTLAVSLGQLRTLIERPAGMTHATLPEEVRRAARIGSGGLRLAVGVEDLADLQRELGSALEAI